MKDHSLKGDVAKHLDDTTPSTWSTLRHVRITAVGIHKIHEQKGVNIEWVSTDTLNYILPNGDKVLVSFQMISDFAEVFQRRAEEILEHFKVPQLTAEQLQSVKDPLGKAGTYASLLTFNDKLATILSANVVIKDEKLLTELHLCGISLRLHAHTQMMLGQPHLTNLAADILSALEGCGQLRFTEAVSQLFSQPNQFDNRLNPPPTPTLHPCLRLVDEPRRTLYWESGHLTVSCGWIKTETTSSNESLKMAKMVVRTCTPRTSHIFIRL